MARVHLFRHARPAPPLVQTSDVPLSTAGLADAKAIVPMFSSLGIRRIVNNPYRRARETVLPFAEHVGIDIELDARLREREMPLAENPQRHVEHVRISFGDPDDSPDSGETFRETEARALTCLRHLATETLSGLLLVEHGQSVVESARPGSWPG
ncbi:MAG: histidine phosphatase family protein [Pseudomonadales bacterium]|jgi:2,3-bisphosphoglycerate-dependent phosphoglycerate mutase